MAPPIRPFLLAHDFSRDADDALLEAAACAAAAGAPLALVHVVAVASPADASLDRELLARGAGLRIERVAATVRQRWPALVVQTRVRAGDAATEILAEAERIAAGTIYLGRHERRGLARLTEGPVACAVRRCAVAHVAIIEAHRPDAVA